MPGELPQANAALLEIRKAMGLTQSEFGAILGVSFQYVSGIEKGSRGVTLEFAYNYAARLGVKPSRLDHRLTDRIPPKPPADSQ